jgi:hypothetical protein
VRVAVRSGQDGLDAHRLMRAGQIALRTEVDRTQVADERASSLTLAGVTSIPEKIAVIQVDEVAERNPLSRF